jgi:signal transduction histidine kinase
MCLDEAIADAVSEFGSQRERLLVEKAERAMSEKLGFLAHEQRNFLNTAILSFAAIKTGAVGLNGCHRRDPRQEPHRPSQPHRWRARGRASRGRDPAPARADPGGSLHRRAPGRRELEAAGKGCFLKVATFEPQLAISADRQLLYSAASNLLQNAFKFTRPGPRSC